MTDDSTQANLSALLALAKSGDKDAAQQLLRIGGMMLLNWQPLPRELALYIGEHLLGGPGKKKVKSVSQAAAEITRARAVADALARPDVETMEDAYQIAADRLSKEKKVSAVTVERAWLRWSKPGPLGVSLVDFMQWNECPVDSIDGIFRAYAKSIKKPVRDLKQRKDLQEHRDVAIFLCRRLLRAEEGTIASHLHRVYSTKDGPKGRLCTAEDIYDAIERVKLRREEDPTFNEQFKAILLTWPDADQFHPRQLTHL